MTRSALLADDPGTRAGELPSAGFDRLQELMRHGYVPGYRPLAGSEGLLLRHDYAPDLVLRTDGSLDVPLGQKLKFAPLPSVAPPPKRKRRWLRGFLILVGIVLYVAFAFGVLAGIMESM